jgi:alpha-amylase
MGNDILAHDDLGDKDQKDMLATRFGSQDSLLHLSAVAHANGLEVYPDTVLHHVIGSEKDLQAPDDKLKKFRYVGSSRPHRGRWAKDHRNFHRPPGRAGMREC